MWPLQLPELFTAVRKIAALTGSPGSALVSPSNQPRRQFGLHGVSCLWPWIWLPGIHSRTQPGLSGATGQGQPSAHSLAEESAVGTPQASCPLALPRGRPCHPPPTSFCLLVSWSLPSHYVHGAWTVSHLASHQSSLALGSLGLQHSGSSLPASPVSGTFLTQ